MIRKITLALILFCIIISCGKKGDPVYKDSKEKSHLQITITNKA